jgi:hypothetical protein
MTPEGSTHVDTFTGTTSSVSRTADGKVAVIDLIRQRVYAALWGPACRAPQEVAAEVQELSRMQTLGT